MKLTIELVPKTAWFKNLRSYLTSSEWDKLRKAQYKRSNYCCDICGGKGPNHPVECHEIWEYSRGKIILKDLTSLCPACHEVKHIGLAQILGNYERALSHFMQINNIGIVTAERELGEAFDLYHKRSLKNWELDVSILQSKLKELE